MSISASVLRAPSARLVEVDPESEKALVALCGTDHSLSVTRDYLKGTNWTPVRAVDELVQNLLDQGRSVTRRAGPFGVSLKKEWPDISTQNNTSSMNTIGANPVRETDQNGNFFNWNLVSPDNGNTKPSLMSSSENSAPSMSTSSIIFAKIFCHENSGGTVLELVNFCTRLYPKAFFYGTTGGEKKQTTTRDTEMRGKFGDGLTSALLALVKENFTVRIISAGYQYSFFFKYNVVACDDCLHYSVKRYDVNISSFSDGMTKTNTFDASRDTLVRLESPSMGVYRTPGSFFHVDRYLDLKSDAQFLFDAPGTHSKTVDLLENAQGQIFVKNMLTQKDRNLMFGVNARGYEMKCRDREGTISAQDLKNIVKEAWSAAVSDPINGKVLANKFFESLCQSSPRSVELDMICERAAREPLSQALWRIFVEKYGDTAIPLANDVQQRFRNAPTRSRSPGHASTVHMPGKLAAWFIRIRGIAQTKTQSLTSILHDKTLNAEPIWEQQFKAFCSSKPGIKIVDVDKRSILEKQVLSLVVGTFEKDAPSLDVWKEKCVFLRGLSSIPVQSTSTSTRVNINHGHKNATRIVQRRGAELNLRIFGSEATSHRLKATEKGFQKMCNLPQLIPVFREPGTLFSEATNEAHVNNYPVYKSTTGFCIFWDEVSGYWILDKLSSLSLYCSTGKLPTDYLAHCNHYDWWLCEFWEVRATKKSGI